jgi:DNA-binding MarR family transcriptional regulator
VQRVRHPRDRRAFLIHLTAGGQDLQRRGEKVWRAVTEAEHLAVWYPQEIVGERKACARSTMDRDLAR